MLERRVYAAVAGQSHQVESASGVVCCFKRRFDLGIVEDGAVGYGLVDFHEVLIDHTSGADVEMAHFRVAHLSVGQTDVFARCLKFGVRVICQQAVPIRSRGGVDYVAF